MTSFRGVLTAMVTPFGEDQSLDAAGARKLAAFLVENGSHGVVVAGTTGEGPTLSDDETIELLEAVLDEIGSDATVICGTGSNDTRHAAALTHRAANAGAHGVLVVSPYYNKPIEDGLRAHFAEVSEAAGETPIVLYNIPSRSVINMSPEFMGSLAKEFGNIAGVKQANNGDMKPIEGLDVLAGNDDIFARCLREGGTGGILVASHIVGPQMREIYDRAAEGDHDGALDIERELSGVYSAIAGFPPASSVKAILSMRGLIGETQRLPMVPVKGPGRETLEEIAKDAS
ncbi:MAG TPA: 4-hydroxy-tetrahydrodipicolinate synthase [Solirubrobacterales bacterium]|nr:4-hydroxy-tetrahydrodipicolinate synthase [Solirubrobacterales bacterium]